MSTIVILKIATTLLMTLVLGAVVFALLLCAAWVQSTGRAFGWPGRRPSFPWAEMATGGVWAVLLWLIWGVM